MKARIMVLIILFALTLFAEDSLRVKTKEQLKLQERERIRTREKIHQDDTEEQDVFVDKNGDGIADDRNFQERHRNWRRNRQLSGKVFRSGSCHEWHKGQSGQNTQGQGSSHGSGSGGGNGG
ncbi:MAG: hypothetical protein H8E11_06870 [Candidatus Cloacimonetes bacterium]|nr:hypothetical protein [Candidatus Cloacimonadota bacterium]